MLEAMARGFDSIGFSEHTYNKYSSYHHQMMPEEMDAYRADVLAVKDKYEGKIDVFCGLEDEYFSEVSREGYDYLIASLHYLDVGDTGKGFDGGVGSNIEYIGTYFDGIHELQGKIPLFEVNTGAISRGYRTVPYPCSEFLNEFYRCGFGVLITSDCHDKTYLDCAYEEAVALIRQAGFRSKWTLTKDGFKEVSL